MWRFLQRMGAESTGLDEIHDRFLEMLADGRHVFDAAANCLLGGGDPAVVAEDLYATDLRINRTEQTIRRDIVVHGSVHGAATFPTLLIMMSVVKDAERIGDYAKNLLELARTGSDLGTDRERDDLVERKDVLSRMLVRTARIFDEQDEAAAQALLVEMDEFQKARDRDVDELINVEGRNLARLVLAHRYFKRVAAHAGNIVTSVVMPLDKLDYYPGKPRSEQ